jgi:hypothetical protein
MSRAVPLLSLYAFVAYTATVSSSGPPGVISVTEHTNSRIRYQTGCKYAGSYLHVGEQIFDTTVARSLEATFSCELAICLHPVTFESLFNRNCVSFIAVLSTAAVTGGPGRCILHMRYCCRGRCLGEKNILYFFKCLFDRES